MHKYFNPGRFVRFIDKTLPYVSVITCVCLVMGLYYALIDSPPDYQQGEYVRIMYIHVPSAWMALFIYSAMAAFSAASLVWKNPLSDMLAKSAAPIGACFAAICLVTGSIWGKPIWGTWWVWDARLTSMLILFFFYIGYIVLSGAYDNPVRSAKSCAILALVGFINVPIVKFSVDWWNTLHQPASILRQGGVSIAPEMMTPLLFMFAGFNMLFIMVLFVRVKCEFLSRKIDNKRLV